MTRPATVPDKNPPGPAGGFFCLVRKGQNKNLIAVCKNMGYTFLIRLFAFRPRHSSFAPCGLFEKIEQTAARFLRKFNIFADKGFIFGSSKAQAELTKLYR